MIKIKKARFEDGRAIPQTYTSEDGKYYIEKGCIGWNLYERITRRNGVEFDEYITTYETLRDIKNDNSL